MYLITKGKGYIITGSNSILLEEGYTYLIPAFTTCTYIFEPGLSHFYIHFTAEPENKLDIYNLYHVKNKVKITALIKPLFERLLEIHPNIQIPHHDPKIYQSKPWINPKVTYTSVNCHLETIGILSYLFSKFILKEKDVSVNNMLRYNVQRILLYIEKNLNKNITIQELSDIACYSKDHFTRVFKSLTGTPPGEFIMHKRIEKARFLLLTTDLTLQQITGQLYFKSASYFCRVFKKHTGLSPSAYRKQRG
jgi:AraC family transcriptional regulator